MKITPFWTAEDAPEFIKRTDAVYSKVKVSDLKARNIVNRLYDSILAALPDGCYIAGGFMTNLLLEEKNAKDIDIFCSSETAFNEVITLLRTPPAKAEGDADDPIWAYRGYSNTVDWESFAKENKEFRFVKFTHETRLSIQVMKMYWYESAEHVIDTFDLTIAQVASCKDFVYMNPLTPMDLAKKKIVLHRMQFPASTIRRIIKYASKGFYACPGSLVNISEAIQQHTGMKDINEEQFVYLD